MKLFNPGPTNVSEEVRDAIKTEDICHREPEFYNTLLRVNKNIIKLLHGEGTHEAILFTASGTGCNEAIISAIHGKCLVLNNGKYSDRLCDIVERYQIPLIRQPIEDLEIAKLEHIENMLKENPDITHILMVHHETTSGVIMPLREIGKLAKKYDKKLVVDSVSAIGGHEFDLQKDNIAFAAVSANKCLEGFPGVSFVFARKEELKQIENKSRSYYFDIYAQWKAEQRGHCPFTPAVQIIFALDVALKQFLEEGYENRIKRYKKLAKQMRAGLKELGFEMHIMPDEFQSNILTAIKIPEWMDYWRVHDKLKERGITIYSGVKLIDSGTFRIATLGNINSNDIKWFLKNFKEVLEEEK